MFTCAWLWIYAGAILMLLELIAPGFIVFFFGLSAASVGVLRFVFGEAFSPNWQLASFSALSVFYILLFRRLLQKVFVGTRVEAKTDFDHESVGRLGRVTEAIDPSVPGRILLGDAEWTAASDAAIPVGTVVKVVAQSNLTMKVRVA